MSEFRNPLVARRVSSIGHSSVPPLLAPPVARLPRNASCAPVEGVAQASGLWDRICWERSKDLLRYPTPGGRTGLVINRLFAVNRGALAGQAVLSRPVGALCSRNRVWWWVLFRNPHPVRLMCLIAVFGASVRAFVSFASFHHFASC